jgi:hypothetical protein
MSGQNLTGLTMLNFTCQLTQPMSIPMWVSFCQYIGHAVAYSSDFCINGTVPVVIQPLQSSSPLCQSASGGGGTAPPSPSPESPGIHHDEEFAPDDEDWVALQYLFSLAYLSGVTLGSYFGRAQDDVEHEFLGWWSESSVYCCMDVCPTYLSAVGNALGYATYVEIAISFVCIFLYMQLFPAERASLQEIVDMAMAKEEEEEEDTEQPPGVGGADAAPLHGNRQPSQSYQQNRGVDMALLGLEKNLREMSVLNNEIDLIPVVSKPV